MKTRIISGVVMAAILAAVIIGGGYFPVIITAALAILNLNLTPDEAAPYPQSTKTSSAE